MKVTSITLNDVPVSLRLTASGLANYAESVGSSGNTLFSVMDALDDIPKQAKLFSAALSYKGNNNAIQDGFELLDIMADTEYDPIQKKTLIVELARCSGVIGNVDAAKMIAAIKAGNDKLQAAAVAILSGDMSGLENPAPVPTEPDAENPI